MLSDWVLAMMLVVASITGSGMVVPQLQKLRSGTSVEGVSGRWIGVSVALNAGWTIYGVVARLWPLLPVSILAFGLYVAMVVALRRRQPNGTTRAVLEGAVVAGLVPLGGWLVGGGEAMGLALGLAYGAQFLPAVWDAYRAPSVAGISATTWVMALVEAMVWIIYGAAVGDAALITGGVGGALCSSLILVALVVRTRPRPRMLAA